MSLARLLVLLPLFTAGCLYSFRGGGGFPDHIRTIYVEPFENETAQFALETELFEQISDRVPRSLGVQIAGQDVANAVLRGKIMRYEDVAQNYRADTGAGVGGAGSGIEILQHQVQIIVSVQIVDVEQNVILWEGSSVTGRGEYLPAEQTDDVGRQRAIQNLIEQILDGAQSQW